MTTAAARAKAAPRPAAARAPAPPALRVVASGPVVLRRLPFAFAVGTLLAVGLIGLLMLHTMAAQDAFRLHDLQHQLSALDDTEQQLAAANQHTRCQSDGARIR